MDTQSSNRLPTVPPLIKARENSVFSRISQFVGWSKRHTLGLLAATGALTCAFVALSSTTAPAVSALSLSADPLYAATAGDKPVLALALSVEYPTVGAQYVDPDGNGNASDDDTYSPKIEYLGYYDAESCYTYDDAGSGAPTGQTSSYKRFVRRGPAIALSTPDTANPTWTTRMCWNSSTSYTKDDGTSPASSTSSNDAFSGNFLNWASSSAIDMLRLSLTGGDRVIDTSTLTVLQRAVIPDGDPINMGNSSNFPSKRLYRSGTSRAITSANFAAAAYTSGTRYFGAVPSAMDTAAGNNDIYVANTLNRIYFGTSKSGNNSGSFSAYTLGISSGLPSDTTWCADENNTCTFTGKKDIWYGAGNSWIVKNSSTPPISCSNATFTDPISGTPKKCYYRTPGALPSGSGLNSDGYFFSRVQVCDRDPSTYALKENRYWNLCTRYSDGATTPHPSYKPTGVVQKYSDQLRLAAFGYLMDQTASYSNGRYGGVLRAPIKYVGAKTFDTNGADNTPTGGNPNQEWSPVTGVFNSNPDSNTTVVTTDGRNTYLSGVVNYLNQFGRTGSVAGRYKKYDPVGELHYEVLRYLQGLPPRPEAVSGVNNTPALFDGFPVAYNSATGWVDPYAGRPSGSDYSCLKSNIVVIGDKNTHDGNHLLALDKANNIPDINAWRTVVQNFEKNISSSYLDGKNISQTTGNFNGANGSVPSDSKTSQIMGSAYWARTHDIRGKSWTNATNSGIVGDTLQRPGLRVKTFIFDVNENGGSNDANTRRTSNQLFMAAKYGGFETDRSNSSSNPYNTWGNPFKREDGTNDNYVWQDTDTRVSRVGEANTYFLQSDARGVLSAFDDIFSRATTAARSIAGGAIQSKNLTQAGNTIFQGTFDTTDWSGDLLAVPITVSGSNVVTISSTTSWTASAQLAAMVASATPRNIVVGKRTVPTSATTAATNFTWADIESNLATDLNRLNASASADGLGQDRLNYLKGDRSLESNPFRRRNKLLGDIVNSGVAYSGEPATNINSVSYSAFYLEQTYVPGTGGHAARTPAVFVGANDGMLHAFNAATGDELFAYIPSWMGPKLSALTATNYVNAHQSYVDGTPVVAEAMTADPPNNNATDWKTVLVAGTGGGGAGVFALDVTNPSSFSPSKVMWEFTNNDDPDMGYVIGKPQILKLRTSAYNATTITYKWFAVVASGVNNYTTANSSGQFGSGYPALFLLDLSKPVGTAWAAGTNYYKISLPVNGDLNYLTNNGLIMATPTGLANFKATVGQNREVAQIYMGDLQGNLWKLDFSLVGTADWNIGKLSAFNRGTGPNPIPYPLFIAKDSLGNVQPITMAPSIAFGPTPESSLVIFGTGKYLESGDKGSTSVQTEYMIYDDGSPSGDILVSPATRASAISGRARLKQGTADTSTGHITTPAFTLGRATTDLNTEAIRSGWYADLPVSGERQISSASISATSVTFGSLIPGGASTGACSVSAGSGNLYTVDIATGNGSFISSTVGIMGEPLLSELTGATTSTISDSTGKRQKTVTTQIIQQGSSGLSTGGTVSTTITAGRLSWRQINNYQDLKNNP